MFPACSAAVFHVCKWLGNCAYHAWPSQKTILHTGVVSSKSTLSESCFVGRISDQGRGILAEDLSKVWQYGYTTINHQDSSTFSGTSDTNPAWGAESGTQNRMGGLGFGLPMSRLYAEYFGKPLEPKYYWVSTWLLGIPISLLILIENMHTFQCHQTFAMTHSSAAHVVLVCTLQEKSTVLYNWLCQ